ncbi:uncharacterized protein CANTADRAFT_25559 [Suhomyces tanzawaensis NRRL Y-17324]|uniref:Lysophospholipase n=1 Tax=Suhomyces tanzawaensis NRRL Y-17324 TaxID=984487 RepID=A0A1E4SJE4_9ASCO|nr:uncharacterized protein CANTADRAFT_25559 [Suhomyces tanzawaensis NRRL Y-17324]ODV79635.1 hypothetical protein CANTADRAFT_25559 [Suhomyces tanzawaensis NRRL Y-17324]
MWSLIYVYITLLVSVVLAKSPTGGYAPGVVKCPSSNTTLIREANSISKQEQDWLKERQKKSNAALIEFLKDSKLKGINPEKFITDNSSVSIALAFSGGGYRAMLSGAGQLAALDNRTDFGSNATGLGGLLQSSNYISALSGGAWMLGSLAFNNFSSVQDIVFKNEFDLWNITDTRQLVNTTSTWRLYADIAFLNLKGALTHMNWWDVTNTSIEYDINAKANAGFNETLTDYWGRGLSYQLLKPENGHGAGTTWSDLRDEPVFANHSMPFPILNALGRKPDTLTYSLNSTVVEFNPFEMGSFDPSLNTFTDLKYIGTNVTNGKPNNGSCIAGYDNAGFVMGTSSSLFNQFLNTLVCEDCMGLSWIMKPIVRRFLNALSGDEKDVANYTPNPFYKSQYAKSNNITSSDSLYLIDGGLGGETIPLSSLLNTERNVDIAFAFDNGNDRENSYPNGSSLVATYARQFLDQGKTTICPYVPDVYTFLANNLTAKPVFFGCDAKNLTDLVKDDKTPPIVVYMANRPFQYYSNTSTFQLAYSDSAKKSMIQNGLDIGTQLNGTIDSEWRSCVACAVIRREEERRGIQQTDQCKKCFERYCWDGSIAKGVPKDFDGALNFTNTGLTNGPMSLKANPGDPETSSFSLFQIKRSENAATRFSSVNATLSLMALLVVALTF